MVNCSVVVDFERNAFITWPGGGAGGFDGSEIVLLDELTLTALQGKLVHVQVAVLRRYQKSENAREQLAKTFRFGERCPKSHPKSCSPYLNDFWIVAITQECLSPATGSTAEANALPCVNTSVTCEGSASGR